MTLAHLTPTEVVYCVFLAICFALLFAWAWRSKL